MDAGKNVLAVMQRSFGQARQCLSLATHQVQQFIKLISGAMVTKLTMECSKDAKITSMGTFVSRANRIFSWTLSPTRAHVVKEDRPQIGVSYSSYPCFC